MSKTHVGGGGGVGVGMGGWEREKCWSGGGGEMKASGRQDKGGATEQRWEIARWRRAQGVWVWVCVCVYVCVGSGERRCEGLAEVRCHVTTGPLEQTERIWTLLMNFLPSSLPPSQDGRPLSSLKAHRVWVCVCNAQLCCFFFFFHGATVYLRFIFGRAACLRSRTTDVPSAAENDIRLVCTPAPSDIRFWCVPRSTNPSFLMSVGPDCTFF